MAITIYENLMEILFCRFGSFAMTVVKNQRYSSMLWLRNAWTANLITRAKHGAEQVAMARPLQWNWQGKDNCKCTQIECISYRDFPSLFQLPESYSWIEKIAVLPQWYWPCYLLGNRSCPAASLPENPSWSTCNPLLSYAFVPPYRSLVFKECHLCFYCHCHLLSCFPALVWCRLLA